MSRAKAVHDALGLKGLKCPTPKCKVTIYAVSGLQELEKLRRHMARAHYAKWTLEETMENRVRIEKRYLP